MVSVRRCRFLDPSPTSARVFFFLLVVFLRGGGLKLGHFEILNCRRPDVEGVAVAQVLGTEYSWEKGVWEFHSAGRRYRSKSWRRLTTSGGLNYCLILFMHWLVRDI